MKERLSSRPMKRGHLILIGGAENKDGDRSVLAHILATTRAEKIVIIPTASAYPGEIERNYCGAFNGFGVAETRCLDIRKASDADTEPHMSAVEDADLVYFSGGDQVRLVSSWQRPVCSSGSGRCSRPAGFTLPAPVRAHLRPAIR